MNAKIVGTGFYVPERIITNDDLVKMLDTSDEWITRKIGVKQRHIVDTESTSDLAAIAFKRAIESAGISACEIDLIILATNTPDYINPACSILIQKKVGAEKAFAFDIRAGGCPGLVYAISIASKFIQDGSCKNVAAIAADVNSKGIDWEDRTTAVIFGDGASCVILSKSEDVGIIKSSLYTDPSGFFDVYVPGGGVVEPFSSDSIKDKRVYLKMNGKAVFNFATTVYPDTVLEMVRSCSYELDDIDFFISHQANINIIKTSMAKLGVPMEKTHCCIERYGNTGGSSAGIALAEAIEMGLIKKGDIVLMTAFGAGLSWGTVLFEY